MDLQTLLQLTAFGLVWGGIYGLVASGLNLVYGTMKILNVAHGDLLMIGAYLSYAVFTGLGWDPVIGIAIVGPAMVLLGITIHLLLVRPILRRSTSVNYTERATLIIFFGLLLILQNGALLIWTADFRSINIHSELVHLGPVRLSLARVIVLLVALAFAFGMYLFMHRSMLGKAIRAVSQDRDTAALMAVDVALVEFLGFGVAAFLAGVTGSLLSTIYVITPYIGLIFMVKAFVITVIGGLGSQIGTFGAALAFGVIESVGAYFVGDRYRDALGYVLLILVVLWRARQFESLRGGA